MKMWVSIILIAIILLLTGMSNAVPGDFSGELPGGSGTVAVNVRTVPDGATVFFDGEKQEAKTPAYYYVNPGVHRMKVTLIGYKTYMDEFSFPEEELPVIYLEKAVEGTLHIDSTPQDASVYLDGEYKGQTPVDILTTVGSHELVIENQLYKTIEKTVELKAERQGMHYNLKPGSGAVYIWSIPEATILIDGEVIDLENNPGIVELDPGTYTITARKEGYKVGQKDITVKGADTQEVYFVLYGPGGQFTRVNDDIINIGITSEPEGATVYINGEERQGKTPGVYRVYPGINQIRLELSTYQIYDEEIDFPDESPLVVPLVRSPSDHPDIQGPSPEGSGRLEVEVSPADATINIDGSNVDISQPLELDVGEYLVKASSDGYISQQDTITIQKDKTTSISIHLVPEEEQNNDMSPSPEGSGRLEVEVSPADATINIDGSNIDISEPLELDVGEYLVKASSDGYISQQNTITIQKDKTTSISINLVPEEEQNDDMGPIVYFPGPDTVNIKIDSDPQGADVLYKGKAIGTTPFTRDVKPRIYLIELRLDGYEPTFKQIDVRNYITASTKVDMETGIWDELKEESELIDN